MLNSTQGIEIMSEKGTLKVNEPHPAVYDAVEWFRKIPVADLARWQESFSSRAIEGNRLGEVCSETLRRIMNKETVSDRCLLGLAWNIIRYNRLKYW